MLLQHNILSHQITKASLKISPKQVSTYQELYLRTLKEHYRVENIGFITAAGLKKKSEKHNILPVYGPQKILKSHIH